MGAYVTQDPNAAGGISGSGTANYLPKFTSASTIGNSTINQDATGNTGIGMVAASSAAFGITTVAEASGQKIGFYFLQSTNTNQTASTEINGANWVMGARQWDAGAITTQREFYIQSCAYSFTSASTITNAYGLYAEAPTAGANATITNAWAAGFSGYVNILADTATIKLRSLVGTTTDAAIYINQTTPSASNYCFTASSTNTYLNASSSVRIRIGGFDRVTINDLVTSFTPTSTTSGAFTAFTIAVAANTGQTASTNIPNFKVTGSSKQWATGAITDQYWNYFSANTAAFVGASTITNSYGLYVEAATAGTNATITNNWALGLNANMIINNSDAAIYLGNLTPSSTNYALKYTAADEISINAPVTGRIRGGGTIAMTWGGTSVTVNASSGLSISNTSSDNKIVFSRTGGSTYSFQHDTASWYLYNNTSSIAPFRFFNQTTSGATNFIVFQGTSNTGQTASTEINGYLYNSYTRQWATGAITTQREQYIKTVTYSFVGASTITNAYGLYVEAPTAGTNATITNNYAAGFSGNINIIGTPHVSGVAGVDGSFMASGGETVTVNKGIITSIV